MDLEEGKQPLYGLIYSLKSVELNIYQTYIKTNLANSFICLLKSLANILILFDQKPNRNCWLFVNYWGLSNITIKNQYPLLLVDESLNCLGYAKQFIYLDLTSTYYRMRIKEGEEEKTAFRTWYGHFEY